MTDARTDAELLSAVRGGDAGAFQALWERHFDAGLRCARRILPARAEDLVSESFLAIYRQLTLVRNGPESAFRAYLRAVIRNTAVHWRNEAEHVVDTDEVVQIDWRDGLSALEREADSADVAAAFAQLPERWQRVLWLAEVAEVSRTEIARELGITPNAVSALQRRARTGMKSRWLARQVPAALREDPAHIARLLPQHLAAPGNATLAAQVAAHIVACVTCADLLHGMRGAAGRVQGRALSAALLGAVGIGLPVTAALTPAPAAAAVLTAAGAGAMARLAAAGIAAALLGAVVLPASESQAPQTAPPAVAATPSAPAPLVAPTASEAAGPDPAPGRPAAPPPDPVRANAPPQAAPAPLPTAPAPTTVPRTLTITAGIAPVIQANVGLSAPDGSPGSVQASLTVPALTQVAGAAGLTTSPGGVLGSTVSIVDQLVTPLTGP
ncbi:RNA polymerase sigma factor [Microbacterium sp. 22242]|uniref:RNA polymerase sigma factor n=1 Tax=Microbacterium sp. 22242 TaxID=3453896 RepID=UPI003F847202